MKSLSGTENPAPSDTTRQLLKASSETLLWLCLRSGFQAASIIMMARGLGAESYGVLVTALATASFFIPLAGLGLPGVVLRDGAHSIAAAFGTTSKALNIWRYSAPVSAGLAVLACCIVVPSGTLPLSIIGLLAAIEVISISLTEMASRAEQTQRRTRAFGLIQASAPATRCIALGLATQSGDDPTTWAIAYAAGSAVQNLVLGMYVFRQYARHIAVCTKSNRALLTDGSQYATGQIASRAQTEFSKPLMAQTSTAWAANFNVAQRVVDLAMLPIIALQEALWPRLLSKDVAPRTLIWTALVAVACAGAVSALLIAGASLIPRMLGPDFGHVVGVIYALAAFPVLFAIRSQINLAVIRRNRTTPLNLAYILATAGSLATASTLVPTYGLIGAIAATYATELILIAGNICILASIKKYPTEST